MAGDQDGKSRGAGWEWARFAAASDSVPSSTDAAVRLPRPLSLPPHPPPLDVGHNIACAPHRAPNPPERAHAVHGRLETIGYPLLARSTSRNLRRYPPRFPHVARALLLVLGLLSQGITRPLPTHRTRTCSNRTFDACVLTPAPFWQSPFWYFRTTAGF